MGKKDKVNTSKINSLDGKLATEKKEVSSVTDRKDHYKGKVAGVKGENGELKGQVKQLIDQLNAGKGLKVKPGDLKAAAKAKGAANAKEVKLKSQEKKAKKMKKELTEDEKAARAKFKSAEEAVAAVKKDKSKLEADTKVATKAKADADGAMASAMKAGKAGASDSAAQGSHAGGLHSKQ